jgi:4-amino-4-deoxy-L-arabinose transferase-like glycosyltransferase
MPDGIWPAAGVALITVLFFATANLPWQLDEFSQDRQALASFQIVKEGRWLYQQAPRTRRQERDATKPPLVAWISTGFFYTTRSWPLAWRVPSAVAAVWLAIALFSAARLAFGQGAALLALASFSFNALSPRLATLVRTDMPLALITFIIGLRIWRKLRQQQAWTRRDRVLMFALLSIGLYVKGPILFVFLLPGLFVYQGVRSYRAMPSAWFGWWPWIASLGLFLPWVIGGIYSQPGFFQQVIVHEFMGRFSAAEQAPHPAYFYVAHLLHKFAPWSELLLIFAAALVWPYRPSWKKALLNISPPTLWLICWVLVGLIIMSLVPSKRIDRVYPLIPPMCLLIAAQFSSGRIGWLLWLRFERWAVAALVLSALLTGYYVLHDRLFLGYLHHRNALAQFGSEVLREAQLRHWRYEAVTAHDGGLLLYLRKTQFIEATRAIALWNNREIDALVVETIDLQALMSQLRDASVSAITATEQVDEKGRSYVLLVRMPAAGQVPSWRRARYGHFEARFEPASSSTNVSGANPMDLSSS